MEITGKSWKYRESCQNDSRILDETAMTRSLRGMNHWSMSEWHPKGPDVVLQASDGCHSAGFPPSTVCVSLITITASARGCGNSWGRRAMFQWVSSYSHPMKSLPLLQLRNHLSWFRKIQFDSLHQQTILTLSMCQEARQLYGGVVSEYHISIYINDKRLIRH